MKLNKIYNGDSLKILKTFPDNSVNCIITSPPYWGLRDYGVAGQVGLEKTLDKFLAKMLKVTAECQRVLRKDGVMLWNHGDCYGGSWQDYGSRDGGQRDKNSKSFPRRGNPKKEIPPSAKLTSKCLALQNWRLILKMIDEQGWILRNTIIWHKPNHMPSSVKDRFANSYEPVYMLVKSKKYWFDLDAVRVPQKEFINKPEQKPKAINQGESKDTGAFSKKGGFNAYRENKGIQYNPAGKNPGDIWKIPTQPMSEAHFATFPEKLVAPMIKAGCPLEVCPKCGKVIENPTNKERNINKEDEEKFAKEKGSPGSASRLVSSLDKHLPEEKIYQGKTVGWTKCKCNKGFEPGIVLDPFSGAGTTLWVAEKLRRKWIGIELNPEYIKIAKKRMSQQTLI